MEQTLNYKLDGFEGPLDLLLQLIARNKYNIYDIPLVELIDQYLEQIEQIKEGEMEVASEFLCFSKVDEAIVVCDATSLERNLYLTLQI